MPDRPTDKDEPEPLHSDESLAAHSGTELARAELDLSQTNGNGSNGVLRTLLRSFEAASLGIGTASLSYPLVSSVVEQAEPSMVLRATAGLLASLAFLKTDQKLSEYNAGGSFLQLLKEGDYGRMTAEVARGGLRTAAFWAFIPTLAATWSDLLKNEATAYKVESIRDRIEVYREDAGMAPAFLEVQADFQKDIIKSLGEDASVTPQSLTKMALYDDGEFVRWNGLPDDSSRVKVWDFSDRGRDWSIVCYDTNHWYVMGPNMSWEVGTDVEGEVVGAALLEKFPKNRLAKDFEQNLHDSGLMDGNPAIVDILARVKPAEPIPAFFDEGLSKLSGFLPLELNRDTRKEVIDNAKQIEGRYLDGYAANASDLKERQFGAGALQDPHSYASTLSLIDSSK